MTFYTGLTILVELFMLAMIIHVMRYSGISKSQRAWFPSRKMQSHLSFRLSRFVCMHNKWLQGCLLLHIGRGADKSKAFHFRRNP